MKNKSIFRAACVFTAASMLVACSSTQTASNFGKRKYTAGYFANNAGKAKAVNTYATNNTTTVTNNPVVASTEAPKVVTTLETSVVLANNTIAANANTVKQVSTVRAFAKSAKKAITATETKSEPSYGEVTAAKEATISASPDAVTSSLRGGGSCKNWIVCIVLCGFLGSLGVHRFYMGYIWQGVVQLITLGGCGIWTLIDFIRIITKSLKPKGGDYC